MSEDQELSEISEILKCLLWRAFYSKIICHLGLRWRNIIFLLG